MSYTPPVNKSEKNTFTTGFSYTVSDGITISILNSAGALATGTVTMPAHPTDGQPLNIVSPKGILAVTISANTGQSFSASPVSVMTANQPYNVKYSAIDSTWYPN